MFLAGNEKTYHIDVLRLLFNSFFVAFQEIFAGDIGAGQPRVVAVRVALPVDPVECLAFLLLMSNNGFDL